MFCAAGGPASYFLIKYLIYKELYTLPAGVAARKDMTLAVSHISPLVSSAMALAAIQP
jgi:hypothetical protein